MGAAVLITIVLWCESTHPPILRKGCVQETTECVQADYVSVDADAALVKCIRGRN